MSSQVPQELINNLQEPGWAIRTLSSKYWGTKCSIAPNQKDGDTKKSSRYSNFALAASCLPDLVSSKEFNRAVTLPSHPHISLFPLLGARI